MGFLVVFWGFLFGLFIFQAELLAEVCGRQVSIIGSNVENFFDPTDLWYKRDIIHRKWSQKDLDERAKKAARILTQDGRVQPDLILLSEVESITAMNSIIFALHDQYSIRYRSAHLGGGRDERGIQVAALVRTDGAFGSPVEEIRHYPRGQYNDNNGTRAIQELVFETKLSSGRNPLVERSYVFAVHLPSLRNPTQARIEATLTLRNRIEKILSEDPQAKIMIIGDFNTIESDRDATGIHPLDILFKPPTGSPILENPLLDLYDLLSPSQQQSMPEGTYFYKKDESFSRLDRILVTRSFISASVGIRLNPSSLRHYAPNFASEDYVTQDGRRIQIPYGWSIKDSNDEAIPGGIRQEGFQDHFPVIVSGIQ